MQPQLSLCQLRRQAKVQRSRPTRAFWMFLLRRIPLHLWREQRAVVDTTSSLQMPQSLRALAPLQAMEFIINPLVQDHTNSVTAVTVHASGNYFVTASADRSWAFYDVGTGTCYTQASSSLPQRLEVACEPCRTLGSGRTFPAPAATQCRVSTCMSGVSMCASAFVQRGSCRLVT